tara:strand:- start:650 stop:1207 length:558 start_codon:yes stop_codon:yes gene_type:complete
LLALIKKQKPVNLTELIGELKNVFESYLKECLNEFPSENRVNGIGIFTDSDMSSFVVYINTVEHLNERNLNADNEDEKLTNKWWLPEWSWESKDSAEQERIIDISQKISNQLEFYDYKKTLFKTYCEILANLSNSDKVSLKDDFVLLVQESDNFNSKTDKNDLSKILSESQWTEYLKFNKYWLGY